MGICDVSGHLQRVSTYFRQFSGFRAFRFVVFEALRKICDPGGESSFAQTGEDRIIMSILGRRSGFFVDVGCNHPVLRSNTFALYKRGWTGINIDANPEMVALFANHRPRDKAVCAVVSGSEREVVFTEFADSLVSSLDEDHVSEWKQQRAVKAERVVETIRLQSLLDTLEAPKTFDLLTVDVEGHDLEVLRSIDLQIYRPELIVIEMHGFDIRRPEESAVCRHLADRGYEMVGYIVMNGYFRDVASRPAG
jgi:FkbM family methyltransferase